jgi:hypothetical protein
VRLSEVKLVTERRVVLVEADPTIRRQLTAGRCSSTRSGTSIPRCRRSCYTSCRMKISYRALLYKIKGAGLGRTRPAPHSIE